MSTIKQIVVGPCDTHCSVAIGIKCWPPSVRPSDTATQWRADRFHSVRYSVIADGRRSCR